MSYVRFNRHSTAAPNGWVWDCYVLPSGEVNGEVHHFGSSRHMVFTKQMTPTLSSRLGQLLDQLPPMVDAGKPKGMVFERLTAGMKTYYSLPPAADCLPGSAERQAWELVNSIFEGTEFGERVNPKG